MTVQVLTRCCKGHDDGLVSGPMPEYMSMHVAHQTPQITNDNLYNGGQVSGQSHLTRTFIQTNNKLWRCTGCIQLNVCFLGLQQLPLEDMEDIS